MLALHLLFSRTNPSEQLALFANRTFHLTFALTSGASRLCWHFDIVESVVEWVVGVFNLRCAGLNYPNTAARSTWDY